MMLADRHTAFRALPIALLFIAAACSDRVDAPATAKHVSPGARFTISDGAHNGNRDVFFLPPMVNNPTKAPGYGDPFAPGLPVAFKIKDLASNAYVATFTGAAVGVNTTDEYYYADWDTKASNLDAAHTYRIEVWIGGVNPAYAEVAVGASASDLKNVDNDQFIPLVNGRTLPIRVRIEKGWNCGTNASCTTVPVPASIPGGGSVIVATPDNLNSLKLTGNWANTTGTVVVTIENATTTVPGGCQAQTNDVVLAANQCIKITMDPQVTLQTPATVGLCSFLPVDLRELAVKYDAGETTQFLDDAPPPIPCPTQTASRSSNPLVRLASAALSGIGRLFGVKPAYAFDTGVGADLTIGSTFSYISPAFPMQMTYVSGDNQLGTTGLHVANDLVVKVAYRHHVTGPGAQPDAVTNATVHCPPASGVLFATNLGGGLYSCPKPVVAAGANTLKVWIDGVLDPVQYNTGDGQFVMLPQSYTFTATGASAFFTDGFETALGWSGGNSFWNRNGNLPASSNAAYPTYVSLAPGDASNGTLPSPMTGSYAAWYGDARTGNYLGTQAAGDYALSGGMSTGANSGSYVSPPITLPANATSAILDFDTWFEIESVNPHSFDVMMLGVQHGATIDQIGMLNPATDPPLGGHNDKPFTSAGFNLPPVWKHVTQDLGAYAGQTVQLVFTFDTRDAQYNGFRGWIIDNVEVRIRDGVTLLSVGTHTRRLTTGTPLNPVAPAASRTP